MAASSVDVLPAVVESTGVPWERDGLVNLWDMEKFAAEKFCTICDNLAGMSSEMTKFQAVTPKQSGLVRSSLTLLVADCESIGLKVTARQVQVVIDKLENYSKFEIPSAQVSQMLDDLSAAISCEMSTKLFLRVYPERESFYQDDDLFGASVSANFGSASRDIKEAGTCYATDRATACVMHLMRVLEVGLSTLAGAVGVSFDRRNWENIINDIEAAIKKISGPAWGPDWKEKLQFYSGAAKDFRYFKDAWRNHAMHHREHYDSNEAKSILEHVKAFMVHLAEGGLTE